MLSSVWNSDISWPADKIKCIVEFIMNPYAVRHFLKNHLLFLPLRRLIDQTERNAFNISTDFCVYTKAKWRKREKMMLITCSPKGILNIRLMFCEISKFLFQGLKTLQFVLIKHIEIFFLHYYSIHNVKKLKEFSSKSIFWNVLFD